MDTADFVALALENPANRVILERLPSLGLADAWLVAGCLFQTAWNLRSGRPPGENIADYDLFYFDEDLSWEAEDREIQRASQKRGTSSSAACTSLLWKLRSGCSARKLCM